MSNVARCMGAAAVAALVMAAPARATPAPAPTPVPPAVEITSGQEGDTTWWGLAGYAKLQARETAS